jgi:uncharacterized protein
MPKRKPKMTLANLPQGEVLCQYCTAKCCRYYSLEIDAPTEWLDYDHMRWFVMHGRTSIFVDNGDWYLCVQGDCQYLLPDNRCGNYENRPQICRDYSFTECEYDGKGVYEKFFESPEQLWEYAEAVLPPRKRPSPKSGNPSLPALPILNAMS